VKTDDRTHDPRWLLLGADKRAVATKRAEVLAAYEALQRRSAEKASEHAAKLSISRSRFFDLLRIWRRTGNPIDLVPHAEPLTQGRSAMDADRLRRVRAVIDKAIAETGTRAPRMIMAAAARLWIGGNPPSHTTLRRHMDKALAAEVGTRAHSRPGTLVNEGYDRASQYGEVLVVDHTAPDIFVDSGDGPVRPTLTLAFDLHNGFVEGYAISTGLPEPALAVRAIEAAETGSDTRPVDAETVRPRLVLSGEPTSQWRELARWLERLDMRVTMRIGYGAPTRRRVGATMGPLRLHARKAHALDQGRSEFDPIKHAVLTIAEARTVVEAAVTEANGNLLEHVTPRRIVFGLRTTEEGAATRVMP
jgi:hypothetical protein